MIIATAGHVDHGKTALIKALTGTDTDRLPEEKARGQSIDLGFAYQSLPDKSSLGFVDVPGHEKFIRNMLAGVGGIDLGLLVVAADDGVMPQTREHCAILGLLGIDQCVVAISRIDRVDDDRILEVQGEVETLLGQAGLEGGAMYPVCAPDNQGVAALKDDLGKRAQAIKPRPVDGYFRMAIDRVFNIKGVGLVVTGMVFSGIASLDDSLVLSADGSAVRVRGIRAHNEVSDSAQAGQRCAINIVGRGVNEDSVHLHIGADRLTARVAVLCGGAIAAGERGLAQLVLDQDAFVVHGDRFVLRDQSAQRTIAGGHVIDPMSPRRGRARPTRIAALRAMNHRDPADALTALTAISEVGVPLAAFSVSHNLPSEQTDAIVESLSLQRIGRHPRQWVFSATQWQDLTRRIEKAVGLFHQSRPELPGASLKDIQLALKPHVETPILEEATDFLVLEKRLGQRRTRFHWPSHEIQIAAQDRQLWEQAAARLAPDSGSPLSLHQAAEALGVDKTMLERSLKNAVRIGEMVMVAKNRYLPTAYTARLGYAAEALAERSADSSFSVAEFCQQTGTGRNFAIELLEYFDRLAFTQRSGNSRRIRRPAATVFALDDEA
jgi:selenocysteine-specific elongation factor